ncbi:MAG: EthD family reductase [Acidobacteria bacterium]|nr:EthD family reductase [Acidobacteriota bacterium]MCZ6661555.1 EthD family reductase [Actinomycetota bacterium]
MSKVIFVLHRRIGLSRAECLEEWAGERHTSVLEKLPGLTKWIQNHVTSAPGEPICDGVGELWFESDQAMNAALNSPEMGAAVDDSKLFLDMERTGMVIVDEKTIIG